MSDDGTWTEALILRRTHGERAGSHVAERIAMLARAGDVAGVLRWREIFSCLNELGSAEPKR